MFSERRSMDVHARSVVTAAIDGVTGEVFRARLLPTPEAASNVSQPANDPPKICQASKDFATRLSTR